MLTATEGGYTIVGTGRLFEQVVVLNASNFHFMVFTAIHKAEQFNNGCAKECGYGMCTWYPAGQRHVVQKCKDTGPHEQPWRHFSETH